jgi:hypothetical protein
MDDWLESTWTRLRAPRPLAQTRYRPVAATTTRDRQRPRSWWTRSNGTPARPYRCTRARRAGSSAVSPPSPTDGDLDTEAATRARAERAAVLGARLLLVQHPARAWRPVCRPGRRDERRPRLERRGVRVRARLPDAAPAPLAERRDRVSTKTLPRYSGRMSGYCWAEHSGGGLHCCLPMGHEGQHYHPYSKTSW